MNIYFHLIVEFKSARNLAEQLQIKPCVVYKWKYRKIPLKYVLAIEKVTYNNQKTRSLTRQVLRPDINWK